MTVSGQNQANITRTEHRRMDPVIQELQQRQQTQRTAAPQQQQEQPQQQTVYQQFTARITALPADIPVAGAQPVQEENVGRKERARRKKEAEKEYDKVRKQQKLVSAEELSQLKIFQTQKGIEQWAERKTPFTKLTMRESMRRAVQGDYSDFENLDNIMRGAIAKQALDRFQAAYGVTARSDPQAVCDQLRRSGAGVSGLLDPALRLALSLAQNDPSIPDDMKAFYLELDEAMSTAVMEETLTHTATAASVEADYARKHPQAPPQEAQEKAREAIAANEAQQIQIAKRLLLMQLSNFQQVDQVGKELVSTPWSKSMAVALSHCSRVVLTLPNVDRTAENGEEAHRQMWSRIFYQSSPGGPANPAQDNKRASSTHSLKRRKVSRGPGATKEKKVLMNLIGQRGMNCAIGGLGNTGVSGQTISNDGSCGHFYSMYKEGSFGEYGAMLMGIESDAYGTKNHLGHTHDTKATGEKASSLGGQRTDEVGRKYGGRQCDLTSMKAGDIAGWMQTLEDAMKRWQAQPGGIGASPEAAEAMKLLAGKKLDAQGVARLRTLCGGQNPAPAQ